MRQSGPDLPSCAFAHNLQRQHSRQQRHQDNVLDIVTLSPNRCASHRQVPQMLSTLVEGPERNRVRCLLPCSSATRNGDNRRQPILLCDAEVALCPAWLKPKTHSHYRQWRSHTMLAPLPGCSSTHVMPSPARSIDIDLLTMFRADFEAL